MKLKNIPFLFLLIIIVINSVFAKNQNVKVQIVTDEVDAVLALLHKRKKQQKINDSDWQKIFKSEGYVRLKKRENSLNRSFEEDDFKKFVLSNDLLSKLNDLEKTLSKWKKINANKSAKSALKYLPQGSFIKAKIYPVIKPKSNSFVFEIRTNPAIFLYLDPTVSKEKFNNTLTHELHHIGFGTVCPNQKTTVSINNLSKEKQTVLKWSGAFGEGIAMLAAAGNTKTHPHKFSKIEDKKRWDKDVANFNDNLKDVESFFLDVLNKKLNEKDINKRAFSFFGIQGPWYTVGWNMSVIIEETFGRDKLIDVFCNNQELFSIYNQAVLKYNTKSNSNLATWSKEFLNKLQ